MVKAWLVVSLELVCFANYSSNSSEVIFRTHLAFVSYCLLLYLPLKGKWTNPMGYFVKEAALFFVRAIFSPLWFTDLLFDSPYMKNNNNALKNYPGNFSKSTQMCNYIKHPKARQTTPPFAKQVENRLVYLSQTTFCAWWNGQSEAAVGKSKEGT